MHFGTLKPLDQDKQILQPILAKERDKGFAGMALLLRLENRLNVCGKFTPPHTHTDH